MTPAASTVVPVPREPAASTVVPVPKGPPVPPAAEPAVAAFPDLPGLNPARVRLGLRAETFVAPGSGSFASIRKSVDAARAALGGAEEEKARVQYGVRLAQDAIASVVERLGAAEGQLRADVVARRATPELLEGFARARSELVAVRENAKGARRELADIRGWKTQGIDVTAAEQAVIAVETEADRADRAYATLAGQAAVAAALKGKALFQLESDPDFATAGGEELLNLATAATAEAATVAAEEAVALKLGLTEADLMAVGTALPTDRIPPQMLWTQDMVNAVSRHGQDHGVVPEEEFDTYTRFAREALDVTAKDQLPRRLDLYDFVALLKAAGADLARIDPGQLRAALAHVQRQRTRPQQAHELAKALTCLLVLDRIGLPTFEKTYLMGQIEQVTRISGAATFKLSESDIQTKFQEIARVANAGGEFRDRFGSYEVELKVAADGRILHSKSKKPSFWSKVGGFFKKIIPVALSVLSIIPSPIAPFAMVANAAYSAYTAVRQGSVLGIVAAAAGLVGGGAALVASRVTSGAAAVAARVATIANAASRTLYGVQAARSGGIAGLAGLAGAVAGGVASVAGQLGTGLQNVADRIGTWANRLSRGLYAAEAVHQGDYFSAVGLGASLASDFNELRGEPILEHVANGAARAGAAYYAIRTGDYAAAAASLANLVSEVGGQGPRLERAAAALDQVARAEGFLRNGDYLQAASALTEAAGAYAGSEVTQRRMLRTAEHLHQAGEAFAQAERGDYIQAASTLARLAGDANWQDEGLKGRLGEAAALFRQAADIQEAVRTGDYLTAASLVSGLGAAYAGRPTMQMTLAMTSEALRQTAPLPQLIEQGRYEEAAALLSQLSQEYGPMIGLRGRTVASDESADVAAAYAEAIESGDYERAQAILATGGQVEGVLGPPPVVTSYVVRPGDTLSAIAERHGVPLQDLLALNPEITNPDRIRIGQILQVPGEEAVLPPPGPTYGGETTPHTVAAGETLSAIASRYGVTLDALIAANPHIENPNLIHAGQVVQVPVAPGSSVPATAGGAPPPAAVSPADIDAAADEIVRLLDAWTWNAQERRILEILRGLPDEALNPLLDELQSRGYLEKLFDDMHGAEYRDLLRVLADKGGQSDLDVAWYEQVLSGVLGGTAGFGRGLWEGLVALFQKETWTGMWDLGTTLFAADPNGIVARVAPQKHLEAVQKLGQMVEGLKQSFVDDWAAAKSQGRTAELATSWATQGLLEVASLFVGVGEIKAALGGTRMGLALSRALNRLSLVLTRVDDWERVLDVLKSTRPLDEAQDIVEDLRRLQRTPGGGTGAITRLSPEEVLDISRLLEEEFPLRGRLFERPTVTGDPTLPPGEGFTNRYGDIVYSTRGSSTDQALARYHEMVHSFLSPRLEFLRESRAQLMEAGYARSQFLRYLEEALAETHAQLRVNGIRGLPDGITFPVREGYVTLSKVVEEGAIGTVVVGGVTYGVYVLAS